MASALDLMLRAAPMVSPGTGGFSTFAIDDAAERAAVVFLADDANAITHVGFRTGAITGTPPTYRFSIQGVDTATGFPDGTVKGGGSPASMTSSSFTANTWYWLALDNSYTPTLGEPLAFVVDYSTGTINASNRIFTAHYTNTDSFLNISARDGLPYALTYSSSAWTKQTQAPIFGIRTASTRYGNPSLTLAQTSNVTTSGHRAVMKFRVPSGGLISAYTVKEMKAFFAPPASGSDFTVGIWNAAGTALQSDTAYTDVVRALGTQNFHNYVFSSPATLDAGTWYYAGIQAAGSIISLYHQIVDGTSDKLAYNQIEAGGATWNGSAWTDQDTWLPAIELTLGDITAAGGGGGGGRSSAMLVS